MARAGRWLLIRRHTARRAGVLPLLCASARCPWPCWCKVAGSRWMVEDGFPAGKELAGLDEHQVRSWTSWHRWTTLAMLARAFLAVAAASRAAGHPARTG